MFEVVEVFKIGDLLSVTLKGKCEKIKNGSKLEDESGNVYDVISVGMTRHDNPSDISLSTDVLMLPCDLEKGEKLFIA